MSATKKIIRNRVGHGARNMHEDVASVQQLLVAAGTTTAGVVGGGWGPHCKKALAEFQKSQKLPVQDYVDPDDDCLLQMADAAKLLIPLPNKTGGVGLKTLHKWFVDNNIRYEPGADKGLGTRAFWGLDFKNKSDYAIQRNSGRYAPGPVMMNCTTYANMMISIFMTGDVHDNPYDADCSCYGSTSNNHVARDRYGLKLMYRETKTKKENYFKAVEDIEAQTKANNLYVVEVAGGAEGGVSHMALLYNGDVYECTTGQPASSCIARPLRTFVANKHNRIFYIFGPCPG